MPVINIPAGQTIGTYTASDFEACSKSNWFPQIRNDLGVDDASLSISGNVVKVTLSEALTFAVTFILNLYGPGN
jgi:roadblock/LC7 domain-containing protein